VGRRLLREHLLGLCKASGVGFMHAEVEGIQVAVDGSVSQLSCSNGRTVQAR
jgi:hypothetical protein